MDHTQTVQDLASFVRGLQEAPLIVVTGAGVSAPSGVTTFRGAEPEAVWNVSDVEMATARFLFDQPVEQWRWYLERFASIDPAQPNPGHFALAELETWCGENNISFLLVTQNIDTLHERAGSKELIKVHGSSDRVRCTSTACVHAAPSGSLPRADLPLDDFLQNPTFETLPKCASCGSFLRAHVLFFDEYYTDHQDYRFAEVQDGARTAGLILFVGTSFSVGVTELFLQAGSLRRVPMFSIDPSPTPPPSRSVQMIRLGAEVALPQLVTELRQTPR